MSVEVPGSNHGEISSDAFCAPFLRLSDCSIRVSKLHFSVLLYISLANTLSTFKPQKVCTMIVASCSD